MKLFRATIDSVKFSSKSELSHDFLADKNRAIYSNSAENFKRPKNREDSSDLDKNLSESIAAPKTFI